MINFGLSTHCVMEHLRAIIAHVRKIREIKKKLANDPLHAKLHEKKMWHQYNCVTEHKEAYYKERESAQFEVVNAYITFRSIEARDRALQAFSTALLPRVLVEIFCCLGKLFKKRKILRTHYPRLQDAEEPQCIIWENLNVSMFRHAGLFALEVVTMLTLLLLTFIPMAYLALIEKKRVDFVKSDCVAMDDLTAKEALSDHLRVNKDQVIGLMHCFCEMKYKIMDHDVVDFLFEDGKKHCEDWLEFHDSDYSNYIMLTILITLTNMLHQVVFDLMGRLFRPRYTTHINFFKTITIFVVQYLNSAIVLILAYNSFLFSEVTVSKNRKTDYIVGPFDEFHERWFLVVGTTIGLVIIVQLVTPHIPLLIMFMIKSFK